MPSVHPNQSSGSNLHLRVPQVAGFTIHEPLHDGGCGVIFRARQDRLGRVVALKLLPEWPPPTDVALERFNRSAYVNAQVPHPNLLTLYDTGTRDGFHYISLEYVTGQTLGQYLSEVGQIDERMAAHVAYGVLRALTALHSREICHRNIKPKNVFLETDGGVRLIGTGLCSCRSVFYSPHLDARPIGTPHFMAPEMIRGCFADQRSDQYSLGVTLYAAVAGRTPFEKGAPLAVMSRHLTDDPIPLKDLNLGISTEFAQFIDVLMAREPDNRFPSTAAALQIADSLNRRAAQPQPGIPGILQAPAPQAPVAHESWLWNVLSNPIATALLAAFATLGLLTLMLFVAMQFGGRTAGSERPVPAVSAPQPAATDNAAEANDFAELLGLDFSKEPELGLKAWREFLEKHPNASGIRPGYARRQIENILKALPPRVLPPAGKQEEF